MERDAFVDTSGFDDAAGGLPLFKRSLRIQALCERIEEVREHMAPGTLRTSAEVVERILKPLFTQLGWDFADPHTVVPGFETEPGIVDFALCHPPGDARILLKIGAVPDTGPGEATHPFHDRTIQALQLAVSVDGREWTFHFGPGRGSIRNREFARFDIVRDPEKQVAGALDGYLAFHAVKSGEAFRQAEGDYSEERFPAEALAAWRRALLGSEVMDRFLKEMTEATGVPPHRDRAEGFIRGQVDSIRWPADPPEPKPARRVGLGDRVWVYDFAAREIVMHFVVGSDPDWEAGEVSRDSAIGHALLGAREGEEREVGVPGQEPRRVRIVLIRRQREKVIHT